MRFSSTIAASAALVASTNAMAYGYGNATSVPVTYVTETYVDYTTYCPEATTLTVGTQTYTVTEATTLTIIDCSCTIAKPVYTSMVTSCSTSAAPVYTPPPVYTSAPVSSAPVYMNSTGAAPSYTPSATGTGSYSAPIATFTGAANNVVAASGAGLAALFGMVAYVL